MGQCARQFTKLLLSLLSHIGEMVGRHGFAHLAVRQHFSPVKSRDLTIKVCNPKENATRKPVPARTLTGLTAVVQLHLPVAIGLQALQRCSGLLNRRARGSTVATHHFMPAWLSSDSSSFVNCRANRPTRVRVSPLAPFHAPVAQFIRAGGFEPPGCR